MDGAKEDEEELTFEEKMIPSPSDRIAAASNAEDVQGYALRSFSPHTWHLKHGTNMLDGALTGRQESSIAEQEKIKAHSGQDDDHSRRRNNISYDSSTTQINRACSPSQHSSGVTRQRANCSNIVCANSVPAGAEAQHTPCNSNNDRADSGRFNPLESSAPTGSGRQRGASLE